MEVILDTEKVIVETTLPSDVIKSLIEKTGKRAVLQGMGSSKGVLFLLLLVVLNFTISCYFYCNFKCSLSIELDE